jgi:hypothetical protein
MAGDCYRTGDKVINAVDGLRTIRMGSFHTTLYLRIEARPMLPFGPSLVPSESSVHICGLG